MSSFKINLIILTSSLFVLGAATVYAEPREESLEQALLQQLHPVVYSSLQSIYHEQYTQYKCIRIVSINERVTASRKRAKELPVDAIHGQKYFEITVGILRSTGEYVELNLKNDTVSALYYLVNYKKDVRPADFKCIPSL
ncbi:MULTISPECIES: hypothetical protein [unclassified Paenibacillus]|uniref:hypothetical protein n=1 Tax=unclassified Paenibacillus TaxID=185978 RepID=UPI00277F73EE|nr:MULTISPECIES: hypothetical protein [unclassified Paenibacillus]MDQ0896441.1 hypothetical protein [Paenibacillus sp. V4I7]MDQ0914015.1 hypothetical protein [Paenibacillus sp. V4I5]